MPQRDRRSGDSGVPVLPLWLCLRSHRGSVGLGQWGEVLAFPFHCVWGRREGLWGWGSWEGSQPVWSTPQMVCRVRDSGEVSLPFRVSPRWGLMKAHRPGLAVAGGGGCKCRFLAQCPVTLADAGAPTPQTAHFNHPGRSLSPSRLLALPPGAARGGAGCPALLPGVSPWRGD